MTDINEFLNNHLAKFSTAPFLFVGSGLSRRYLNLETWGDLLERFSEMIDKDYQYYHSSSDGNYPKLATLLANDFHEFWWKEDFFQESRDKNKGLNITKESALKIEISAYIENIKEKLTKDEDLLKEISLLRQAIIDGVITTNWDLFLENIFKDFKPYIGQNELIFSVQQEVAEIYKIHGCCSQPNSLVLTEKDYEEFEKRNHYLSAKLLTIFTEHPIIFLGYSLTDSNVNRIIRSITTCLTNENINKLQDRLIFISWSKTENKIEPTQFVIDEFQIPIIKISADSFLPVFESLSQIKRKFPAKILRKLKEHVYDLVKNSEESHEKLYVQDIEEDTDFKDLEVVFGVGAVSKAKETGYSAYERNDLFKDIVFNKMGFENIQIIEKTLPKILTGAKYVPVFKYLRNANLIDKDGKLNADFDFPEAVVTHFNRTIEKDVEYFYPSAESYVKKKELFEKETRTLLEFAEELGETEVLKYFPFFTELVKDSECLRVFAEKYFYLLEAQPSTNYTEFKKLICLYDYLKFYRGI